METHTTLNLGWIGQSLCRKRFIAFGYILFRDPIALVERLDILMASKAAGNTGVRSELVAGCDELLRQDVFNKPTKNTIVKCSQLRDYEKQYSYGRHWYLRFHWNLF